MNSIYRTSAANAEPSSIEQLKNRKFPGKGSGRKTRHQLTVFYVDENPKARRLLAFVLEGCGYKVVTACNSGEALRGMKQTSCDLIVLACRRSQKSGSELALELKQFSLGIPIVLLSEGTVLTPDELTHVNAHVGKGATLDHLLFKIQALIRQASH
jgi:CheY-like chemotaxis protein